MPGWLPLWGPSCKPSRPSAPPWKKSAGCWVIWKAEPPKRVLVRSPQGLSGYLLRDDAYLFSHDPQGHAEVAPALGMPFRPRPYESPTLRPIFQMNRPEGYMLEQLRQRLAKTSGLDPLLLLSVIGAQAPIGRLRYPLENTPPRASRSQVNGWPICWPKKARVNCSPAWWTATCCAVA